MTPMPLASKALISLAGCGIAVGALVIGMLAHQSERELQSHTSEQNHAKFGKSCAKTEAYSKALEAIHKTSLPDTKEALTLNVTIAPKSAFTKACVEKNVEQAIDGKSFVEILAAVLMLVGVGAALGGVAAMIPRDQKPSTPKPQP